MIITVQHQPENHRLLGLGSALSFIRDMNVIFWQEKNKPIWDMMEEKKPDILIMDSQYITPNVLQAAGEYNTSVVSVGYTALKHDQLLLIYVPSELPEIIVKNMKKESPVDIVSLPYMANIALFRKGVEQPYLKSDILYFSFNKTPVGNIPNLYKLLDDYNVKILGPQYMSIPCYLGSTSYQRLSDALVSTRLYLDLDGTMWRTAVHNGVLAVTTDLSSPLLKYNLENIGKMLNGSYRELLDSTFDSCKDDTYFVVAHDMLKRLGHDYYAKKVLEGMPCSAQEF